MGKRFYTGVHYTTINDDALSWQWRNESKIRIIRPQNNSSQRGHCFIDKIALIIETFFFVNSNNFRDVRRHNALTALQAF